MGAMMSYDRRDPAKAYSQAQAEALELLAKIQLEVAKPYRTNTRDTWGQVGNLGHVVEVLDDLAKFLT